MDRDDKIVVEAHSGPGNPLSAGEERAAASLRDVVQRLLDGSPNADLRRAHFGVAGAGRPSDVARVKRLIETLKLPCPFGISDDAKTSFYAAADPPGAVLVSGTGSIAVAYGTDGKRYRSGGHGYLLGDEGGGYWIGREAVRAALRSADGRAEPSELTEAVPRLLGRASLDEIVSDVYSGAIGRPELAALASRVMGTRDPETARILEEAAGELVLAVRATLRGAGIRSGTTPAVVLSGGLLREGRLRRAVEERLVEAVPAARVLADGPAPALGAARLASLAGALT